MRVPPNSLSSYLMKETLFLHRKTLTHGVNNNNLYSKFVFELLDPNIQTGALSTFYTHQLMYCVHMLRRQKRFTEEVQMNPFPIPSLASRRSVHLVHFFCECFPLAHKRCSAQRARAIRRGISSEENEISSSSSPPSSPSSPCSSSFSLRRPGVFRRGISSEARDAIRNITLNFAIRLPLLDATAGANVAKRKR
jgi:hypothetical protein